MATAKITMPGGISVEIDGSPDEITTVLEKVKRGQVPSEAAGRGASNSRGEISGLIATLKLEEFFRVPQGLSNIQRKLAEIGHHYPLTTLSGAMQSQSRKRNLRRFKKNGKYVYVQ